MKKGFTLTELLIVIAIIMLVLLLALINMRNQIAKARDAGRKGDLSNIQKSIEEYFNDRDTYPEDDRIISYCGSTDMAPYLPKVPCDPILKLPYLYVVGQPSAKDGYVLCAKLENRSDPDITRLGCDPVVGCGWAVGYNYCLSAGMLAVDADGIAAGGGILTVGTPTPTRTPTPMSGQYACSPAGVCNSYANPVGGGCPFTYADRFCYYEGVSQCLDPANRCTNY